MEKTNESQRDSISIEKNTPYQRHKEKRLVEKKIYYIENKSIIKEKNKKRYHLDKQRICQQHKDYRAANRDKVLQARKKHYAKNKLYIIKKSVEYEKKRTRIDSVYKLNKNFKNLISNGLKRACVKKNARTFANLPYTLLELVSHLESQFKPEMSWSNYGTYWHIDHIIPVSWFKIKTQGDIEFQRCWALDNLQPLEASINLRKNGLVLLRREIQKQGEDYARENK